MYKVKVTSSLLTAFNVKVFRLTVLNYIRDHYDITFFYLSHLWKIDFLIDPDKEGLLNFGIFTTVTYIENTKLMLHTTCIYVYIVSVTYRYWSCFFSFLRSLVKYTFTN